MVRLFFLLFAFMKMFEKLSALFFYRLLISNSWHGSFHEIVTNTCFYVQKGREVSLVFVERLFWGERILYIRSIQVNWTNTAIQSGSVVLFFWMLYPEICLAFSREPDFFFYLAMPEVFLFSIQNYFRNQTLMYTLIN